MATEEFKLSAELDTTKAEADLSSFKSTAAGDPIKVDAEVGEVDTTTLDETDVGSVEIPAEVEVTDETMTSIDELATKLGEIPVIGRPLAAAAENLTALGSAGETAAKGIGSLLTGAGALGFVGVAVAGVSAAWDWYSNRAEEAKQRAEELAEAHRDVSAALAEGDITAAASQFEDLYGDALDLAERYGVAVDEATAFITGQADAVPSLTSNLHELTQEERDAIDHLRIHGEAMDGYTEAQTRAIAEQARMQPSLEGVADALADSRHQYAEQGDVLHDVDQRTAEVAAGLTGAAEAEGELADGAAGSTEALEAQRAATEQAERAATEFATTISSTDWANAELEGATSALSTYTAELFAAGNQAQSASGAYRTLSAAIEENGLTFDTTTEAGAAVQDALEGVAQVVDVDLAEAFDRANGNVESFRAQSKGLGEQLRLKLINDFNLTEEAAGAVVDELGLLDDTQIDARFSMSGLEEARVKVGLLQSTIALLDEPTQAQVILAIEAGDYQGALDLITDAAAAAAPEVVATVTSDATQYENEMDVLVDSVPSVTMSVDGDTAPASGAIEDVEEAPHDTTIAADADTTEAAGQLLDETTRHRTATIYALAQITAAKAALDSLMRHRSAAITAVAHTANAEAALNRTARSRTSHIYTVTHGGGWGSSGGRSRAAAAPSATATTAVAPTPTPITINVPISAAVIGDRYDVQRTVTRAVKGAARLAGARLAEATLR